jgi:hypothetical protein
VVLGQSKEVFLQHGLGDVESWEPVASKARRRRSYFDRRSTLALYIASGSDIDDILPMLTGFQIEWNKMHRRLRGEQARAFLEAANEEDEPLAALAAGIGIEAEDLDRLRRAWGENFWIFLRAMASAPKNLRVRLLAGSLNDYRRATQAWWEHIVSAEPSLAHRPIYFVSSNPHSLVNLVSGFALRHQDELVRFLERPQHADLLAEWRDIESRQVRSSRENFLYYALKKCAETPECRALKSARQKDEDRRHQRIASHGFDVTVQLIDLQIRPTWWTCARPDGARRSDAVIVASTTARCGGVSDPVYVATRVGRCPAIRWRRPRSTA